MTQMALTLSSSPTWLRRLLVCGGLFVVVFMWTSQKADAETPLTGTVRKATQTVGAIGHELQDQVGNKTKAAASKATQEKKPARKPAPSPLANLAPAAAAAVLDGAADATETLNDVSSQQDNDDNVDPGQGQDATGETNPQTDPIDELVTSIGWSQLSDLYNTGTNPFANTPLGNVPLEDLQRVTYKGQGLDDLIKSLTEPTDPNVAPVPIQEIITAIGAFQDQLVIPPEYLPPVVSTTPPASDDNPVPPIIVPIIDVPSVEPVSPPTDATKDKDKDEKAHKKHSEQVAQGSEFESYSSPAPGWHVQHDLPTPGDEDDPTNPTRHPSSEQQEGPMPSTERGPASHYTGLSAVIVEMFSPNPVTPRYRVQLEVFELTSWVKELTVPPG